MSKFLKFINEKNRRDKFGVEKFSRRKLKLDIRTINIAMVVMICCATIVYLAEINSMAIQGFKIKELEERQAILKSGIKKIEAEIAEKQSTQNVKDRIGQLGMVGVRETRYVSGGGSVAVK